MGYDAATSLELLAGLNLAAVVGNLTSLLYVDRVARHILISVGVMACTVMMSCQTALQAVYNGSTNKHGLAGAASFLFLFAWTFNLFLEGVSWYYASEIFPTHLRAKGMTIGVIGFALIDILWLELEPTAFATIGWRYFLVFVCISPFSAAIIYFTFPNTLRLPLEEVAKLFGDTDLVAVYQANIHIDHEKHQVVAEAQDVQTTTHHIEEKA